MSLNLPSLQGDGLVWNMFHDRAKGDPVQGVIKKKPEGPPESLRLSGNGDHSGDKIMDSRFS